MEHRDEEAKQVIVWRKDLKVRKGKMAVQCAHASLKVFADNISLIDGFSGSDRTKITINFPNNGGAVAKWLNGSFTKICVGVEGEDELVGIYKKAQEAGLPCSLVIDSGRTEFDGPTKTAVAVGPGWASDIDKITGKLQLM